jgi:hypothetical protein
MVFFARHSSYTIQNRRCSYLTLVVKMESGVNWRSLSESGDRDILLDKLPIRFCDSCGCVLEFRYTEYVPSLKCSLLGYCCINRSCAEFGEVFEPSWSDILILSQLGFALRKFRSKKN